MLLRDFHHRVESRKDAITAFGRQEMTVGSLHMTLRAPASLILGVFVICACGGDASSHGGSLVIARAADADNLLPPVGRTLVGKAVADALFDKLADIGPELNTIGDGGFRPRLAQRWEWSPDSLHVTFHLDPRARWHDGRPVRALDVRFAFAVYTDTVVGASGGGDLRLALDSISVADSLTVIAWFKSRSPEHFYTLVTTLVPLPEHLLGKTPRDSLGTSAFGRQPVGSGPFRLVRWQPQERIEIAAVDSFYRGRAKVDRVIYTVSPDMPAASRKFLAGEADFLEQLTPDAAAEAAKHPDLRVVPYGSFDYGFLRLNLHDGASARPHPIFGDRALRRALTMALDRRGMVRSVFDSLALVGIGPFVRAHWSSDTTLAQLPFDRAAAARVLDSLGWRAGADSMRARNGRPLAFTVLTPSSSRNRGRFAVLIQEQLRQLGIKVNIEALDFSAFIAREHKHDFDALMDGIHPSESPSGVRDSWSSAGIRQGNGPNYGEYSNAKFDAQVDSAVKSLDVRTAKAHYRAAYQIIIDDAVAVWLYEPVAMAGVNKRLKTGVLHPNAWWSDLAEWTVGRP
jgi:peptide/nickel transport system substrate-binding protein